jgi:hypothetical protein
MHINQIRTLLATTPPTTRAAAAQANDDALLLSLRAPSATDALHASVRFPLAPRHWL